MKKLLKAVILGVILGIVLNFGIVFAEENSSRPYFPIVNPQFWIIGSLLFILFIMVCVQLGKTMKKHGRFVKIDKPIAIYYPPKTFRIRDKDVN